MSAEVYAALPETLVVRELRYALVRPGFRTHSVTLQPVGSDPRLPPVHSTF